MTKGKYKAYIIYSEKQNAYVVDSTRNVFSKDIKTAQKYSNLKTAGVNVYSGRL